jgi:GR25 family glycosyltransferase involved in LPS biosynthesis
MKCYVINLKEADERLAFFREQIKTFPILTKHLEIFSAISKNDKPLLDELKKKYKVTLKNGGEAGCTLSHLLVLKKFIESGEDYCAVLEDDAKVLSDDLWDVDTLMKDINISEFDILYLTKRISHNAKYEPTGGWGTEGYIVSKVGAKRVYELFTCSAINVPIDNLIQSHIKGMKYVHHLHRKQKQELWLNAYRVKSPLVKHFPNGKSYIGKPGISTPHNDR